MSRREDDWSAKCGNYKQFDLRRARPGGVEGDPSWHLVDGVLPEGLTLEPTGVIQGTATEATDPRKLTITATDAAGHSDEHTFTIEVRPGLFEAYYGLAAALQRNNDIRGSLQVLEDYMARYGENEQLAKARQILQQALSKEQNP